jgi:hypothetical protein
MLRLDLLSLGSLVLLAAGVARAGEGFDRTHMAWTTLLARHVRWNAAGTATAVDYAGFARDRAAFDEYRAALEGVAERDFAAWPVGDRLAFLVNAYNAHTVALVLTRYPDLASIKDLGGLFSSPWKQRFFDLLGEQRSLDDVEHGLIRGGVGSTEPRVHFALNCASIGCPALRPEAYRGDALDGQLADQTRRFLSDRSRNRFAAAAGRLEVSKIFDWYGKDFAAAAGSLARWLASHAPELGDDAAVERRIAAAEVPVGFLEYDWRLNAAGGAPP